MRTRTSPRSDFARALSAISSDVPYSPSSNEASAAMNSAVPSSFESPRAAGMGTPASLMAAIIRSRTALWGPSGLIAIARSAYSSA